MPVLEIGDDGDGLQSFAKEFVLATTTYPEDTEKRHELLAALMVGRLLEETDMGSQLSGMIAEHFPFLLASLFYAPRPEEITDAMARHRQPSWTAGEILLTALSTGVHHPELDVTLSKVVHALSKRPPVQSRGVVYTAKRSLWKAWSRFRTVAHFYAVRQLWLHQGKDIESFTAWEDNHFKEYLAQAEAIRKEAVTRRFIGHDETWRFPDRLRLPKTKMHLEPIRPELIKLIRDYRPEHSR